MATGSYSNSRPLAPIQSFTTFAAKAVQAVAELRQAGLFREVYVTDRTSDPNAQLLLRGTIISTDWDGTAYSYLIGPYAGLFYILGLPMGSVQDTLNLKLELVDNSNGHVLWTDEISQNYAKTEGLYYNYAEDFGYPQMFRDGITPAIASLQSFVAAQPPGSWKNLRATTGARESN